jgi:cell division septal protein FtsQ
VALIERGDGLYFIERDGTAFERIGAREKTDLPVLTGFSGKGPENREMILKSLELLDFMASYSEIPEIRHISEIHGDDLFGFSLFAEGLCIKLGFGDYDAKLRRMKPVMADLARRNLSGYFIIDLNNPGKVTVQLRDFRVPVKVSGGVRA